MAFDAISNKADVETNEPHKDLHEIDGIFGVSEAVLLVPYLRYASLRGLKYSKSNGSYTAALSPIYDSSLVITFV